MSLWSLREFIYVNLSECHFHRVGVGYCESPDFAAAFTEFEDLAIAASEFVRCGNFESDEMIYFVRFDFFLFENFAEFCTDVYCSVEKL